MLIVKLILNTTILLRQTLKYAIEIRVKKRSRMTGHLLVFNIFSVAFKTIVIRIENCNITILNIISKTTCQTPLHQSVMSKRKIFVDRWENCREGRKRMSYFSKHAIEIWKQVEREKRRRDEKVSLSKHLANWKCLLQT